MKKEHKNCIICNSNGLNDLETYKASFLCKCNSCGFVFSKQIPTAEELELHYDGYGRNDYLSPATIKRYNELLDKFEKYRRTNNLLDVGCGIGYFLEQAKKRGWNVFGTEYTDSAIKICSDKGIEMEKGKLDPSNYDPESFDIIVSFEVIEHINNPVEELGNFNQLLRRGGLVYCTTPNFNSLLRYRLKAKYNVITYPEHLSYYTPRVLKKVFKGGGFDSKKIETTGFSLTRLSISKGTSTEKIISKTSQDEKIRIMTESNKLANFAKRLINKLLSAFGVGDSLKGWFVKY